MQSIEKKIIKLTENSRLDEVMELRSRNDRWKLYNWFTFCLLFGHSYIIWCNLSAVEIAREEMLVFSPYFWIQQWIYFILAIEVLGFGPCISNFIVQDMKDK